MRIKLPGSRKIKSTVLAVCAAVAIVVIVTAGINNKKEKQIMQAKIEQQQKQEKEDQEKIKIEIEEKKKKQQQLDQKAGQADALFYARKYDDAIKLAEEVIKEDPDNYIAYNVLGITKIFKSRTLDEGMKDLDRSLQLKSDYGYAMFNKGLAYELLGYYDEAIEWYNKNLKVEKYVWSYYGIASVYGRRGDVENTVKYFKKAIEVDPKVKETAKDEHDFDPVRGDERFSRLLK